MHAFCALKMLTKLPFLPNVGEFPKSSHSHHEDLGNALICGWFGDVFSVLIALKLASLADLKSIFYKAGFVGS